MTPLDAPPPRLLDRVRAALRARHCSLRTEKAYVGWIRRYILFHGKRHPAEMGPDEIARVSFRWFGSEVPDFGRELLSHLAAIVALPLRNAKAGRVTALVYVPEAEDADVEVVLAEASAYDDRGIAYEMTFNRVGERYPGWFALPDG